jgi:hypothetical protein
MEDKSMTALDFLYAVVALLVAISLASERLVEIIKGVIPFLNTESSGNRETYRRLALHILAILAGVLTVYLAKDAFPDNLKKLSEGGGLLALGLLASGGSSFWNSILTYLVKVKDIKEVNAVERRLQVRAQAQELRDQQAIQELERGN